MSATSATAGAGAGAAPSLVVRFDTWIHPVFDETLEVRPGVALRALRFADPAARNLEVLAEARVLHLSPAKDEVPREWFVTERLLAQCPELLCVSSGGAGYDTIDVEACTRAGVAVMNQAGANAVSVAEHTFALLLAVTRRIAESDRLLRGTQRGFVREDLMGREIHGRTIGLVGIGHIGTRVATLARAFGMQVVATDPFVPAPEIERRGATPLTLDELLECADVVSLHCPLNAATTRMIDARAFGRMKRGAVFVTTARGRIHDEQALVDALDAGRIAGAGLDVWDVEPPPVGHPLLAHPSVVATYHTAGVTHEARRNVATMAAAQIAGALAGQRPPRLVNPQVWPAWEARYRAAFGCAPGG